MIEDDRPLRTDVPIGAFERDLSDGPRVGRIEFGPRVDLPGPGLTNERKPVKVFSMESLKKAIPMLERYAELLDDGQDNDWEGHWTPEQVREVIKGLT